MTKDALLLTIAVLGGTGREGKGLAYRWAKAGYRILIGSRSSEKAVKAASEIMELLEGSSSVVGTTNPEGLVDVSHRGGPPGFVHVERSGERTLLTLPDYAGNNLFNSLGNIQVNPRAGFVACDFATGDLLLLTGPARVLWDAPERVHFARAERLLQIEVEAHVSLSAALPELWFEVDPVVPSSAPRL